MDEIRVGPGGNANELAETLAEALTRRLTASGVARAVALTDLMQLEQHLHDELAIVRRLIDAVIRSSPPL